MNSLNQTNPGYWSDQRQPDWWKAFNLSIRFSLQATQQKRPHRANPTTKVFRTTADQRRKKKGGRSWNRSSANVASLCRAVKTHLGLKRIQNLRPTPPGSTADSHSPSGAVDLTGDKRRRGVGQRKLFLSPRGSDRLCQTRPRDKGGERQRESCSVSLARRRRWRKRGENGLSVSV